MGVRIIIYKFPEKKQRKANCNGPRLLIKIRCQWTRKERLLGFEEKGLGNGTYVVRKRQRRIRYKISGPLTDQ